MLDKKIFESLKRVNVSKSPEKTKERIRELWAKLPKEKREKILSLADVNKVTVERAYKTGSVQLKVVVAMSQILQIDPLYITGETDDIRPYDDSLVVTFLNDLGYKEIKNKRKYTKSVKAEKPPAKEATKAIVSPEQPVSLNAIFTT